MPADINTEWARAQVEALVDDALDDAQRNRMQDAMAADPSLAAAVARARAVRRALHALPVARAPRGLLGRLLAIPGGAPRRERAFTGRWWAALGTAATAALVTLAVVIEREPEPSNAVEPRTVAAEEFELAMRYMRKSAVVSRNEVNDALAEGLRDAFVASRKAVRDRGRDEETGG